VSKRKGAQRTTLKKLISTPTEQSTQKICGVVTYRRS